jgi:hypothetical protein
MNSGSEGINIQLLFMAEIVIKILERFTPMK